MTTCQGAIAARRAHNDKIKVKSSTNTKYYFAVCLFMNIHTGGIHCEDFDAAVTQLPSYDPQDIMVS